jgi:lipoyl(octanoyl) transferase
MPASSRPDSAMTAPEGRGHASQPGDRTEASVCHARRLGLVEYEDGVEAQRLLASARKADRLPDQLLLLEHPHVVTVGRRTRHMSVHLSDHLRAAPDVLARLDVELHETDRGGAVTYHGPGQLVVYPIVKLTGRRRDVHRYLRDLEEVIIRVLRDFGIAAGRRSEHTGVWVGEEKIASIGVHLSQWVTTHGFALNVNTDIRFFELIVPCGLPHVRMTSMERVLGSPVPMEHVQERVIVRFQEVFERHIIERPIEAESVQVLLRTPEGTYLLLKRTEREGGFWQPVTGFIEPGESPVHAALREVREETGLDLTREGLSLEECARTGRGSLPVLPLPYIHAFALSVGDISDTPPFFVREYSFLALIPSSSSIRVNPSEHDAFRFEDVATALSLVPWKGNRRALIMSERLWMTRERKLPSDEVPLRSSDRRECPSGDVLTVRSRV